MNPDRFILDLSADIWCAFYTTAMGLVLSDKDNAEFKKVVESLEMQALNNGLMSKENLLEWRQEVLTELQG